ncbi:MAG: glycoside hydrolase family 57 protein [Candidatus Roizmanbacteria bacterium]
MSSVCFYFQVHQPFRVKKYRIFDVGHDHDYFNDYGHNSLSNEKIFKKVMNKCYLPTNAVMLELLKKHPQFKISYSISGVAMEQMEMYAPEVIESFQKLVNTGRVELLSETYYHSLSFLFSKSEFERQILLHKQKVKKLFDYEPKVFRNTELIFNNELAHTIESMGFDGILAEGVDRILDWRSPNFLYTPVSCNKIKLLLKNYRLSDDIAFRFSSREWSEWPLTAPKFSQWVNAVNGNGEIINLFMDYETFGEHQWDDTGIFNFLKALPGEILKHPDNDFVTPTEAVKRFHSVGELDFHHFVSWADTERDLSAWLSNPMQHDAIRQVYDIEEKVLATEDEDLIHDWRKLQTSDHFYYMCTKWFADGDVHKYFSPYETPYDAFIVVMYALHDLKLRVRNHKKWKKHSVQSSAI